MKKFKGRMLVESEIVRFWNVVKKDLSTLGYDVDGFLMPKSGIL